MNQCFKLQKYNKVFIGENIPTASLKLKWLTQRIQARFRRHFTAAYYTKHWRSKGSLSPDRLVGIGEISGLDIVCGLNHYKYFTNSACVVLIDFKSILFPNYHLPPL